MSVERYEGAGTEYQGTSFTRTLIKKDKTAWDITDEANWILFDPAGAETLTGDLTKVNSAFGLKFILTQTDTATLLGNYILVAFLTNTGDAYINEILAYYTLYYNELKAK